MVLAARLEIVPDVAGGSAPASVPRRALLDVLGPTDARLVSVHGPAGSGKSTLLRQWAWEDDRLHVHVALAPQHDDAALLAHDLLEALERIGPVEPAARSAVSGVEPAFSAVVLPGMSDLAGSREAPYVLVLDDLHLLDSPDSLRLVRALADGVPEGSALALASRAPGPPWLGRARADGVLVEITPSDLAFDADETTALMAGLGLETRGDAAGSLLADSEGWAVAVYLLGLARRGERRPHRLPAAAPAGRGTDFVVDYIRSEVLEPLDPALRGFLVASSMLDEQDAGLCDSVLQRDDSAVVLHELAQATALVRRADPATAVYRYHHLLTEALRRTLADTTDATGIAALHLRAARWYADHDDLDSAVRHARSAGDLDEVARLVWSGLPTSVGTGRSDELTRWLSELTDTEIGSDPWLSLAAAWAALQAGREVDLERWTLRSEHLAGRGWRERASSDEYAAELAMFEALVCRHGLPSMPDLCADALEGMRADSPIRSAAAFLLGVSLTLLRRPGATEALVRADRYARALDVPLIEADTVAFRGMLAIMGGDIAAGVALIDRSAELIDEHRLERLVTAAHTLTAHALALALAQDRTRATHQLGAARRLTTSASIIAPWFQVLGPCVQARTALILGDAPLARTLVAEARAALTPDLRGTLAEELLDGTEEAVRSTGQTAAAAATLTPAELRVLAFLPSHLTFPQIGEHLFLSASTVKTHALAIYRKLGVSSRDDAVSAARRLGLVEAPLRG